jgi:hypothetical protein
MVYVFNLSYLITFMAYLSSQRNPNVQIKHFMFDWTTDRIFVPNTAWKRDFFEKMIFVNISSTWSMVQLKRVLEVNNKKWLKWWNFVSPFLFNNTYGLPVLTVDTKCPNQVFYVWLVDLQTICVKYVLEKWFPPKADIRKYLLDMKHGWIKNAFWDVKNKKWRKWCKFV